MYLHDIETKFNRPERNFDDVEIIGDASIFRHKVSPYGASKLVSLELEEINKIHWYIGTTVKKSEIILSRSRNNIIISLFSTLQVVQCVII